MIAEGMKYVHIQLQWDKHGRRVNFLGVEIALQWNNDKNNLQYVQLADCNDLFCGIMETNEFFNKCVLPERHEWKNIFIFELVRGWWVIPALLRANCTERTKLQAPFVVCVFHLTLHFCRTVFGTHLVAAAYLPPFLCSFTSAQRPCQISQRSISVDDFGYEVGGGVQFVLLWDVEVTMRRESSERKSLSCKLWKWDYCCDPDSPPCFCWLQLFAA